MTLILPWNESLHQTRHATGSSHLKLTKAGFEQRVLFRSHSEAWENIQRFEVVTPVFTSLPRWKRVSSSRMVGVVYEPDHASSTRGAALVKVNRSAFGVDGALSDTYGMSADDLAEVMNDWLQGNKPFPP